MARIRKIQNSADYGRVLVDEQLERLEKDISSLYNNAAKDMTKKLSDYLKNYDEENKDKRSLLDQGKITQEEYDDWLSRRTFDITRQKAQIADLTKTMVHADEQAMAMIRGEMPEIYATSYNFGGYRAETFADAANMDYTSFTVYNADAVRILATKDPDLLPAPRVDIPKDERWNRQHIQNAISQGILQGESINKIAGRLRDVTDMDQNAALRNARTMVNSAENRGRKDAVDRVAEDGIKMTQVWSATHDSRTRDSHILLDGTQPDENGYFANGLMYPCDPNGDPAEVYNCRCSLLAYIPSIDHSKDQELYEKMMEEEYYDDWLTVKEQRAEKEAAYQERRSLLLGKQESEKPAEIEYPKATNRKEAVNLLNDIGFTKVSSGVNKIDEQLLVDNVNQLSKLNAKFNAIPNGMEFKTGKMNATAYVGTYPYRGTIVDLKLSTNEYNMYPDKTLIPVKEWSIKSNWSMPCSEENFSIYTITHEYGHILQFNMIYTDEYKKGITSITPSSNPNWIKDRDQFVKENQDKVIENMRKEIIGIAKKNNPDFDISQNISNYGKKNSKEFFAETFANSQLGEPNELGNAMNEWLRGKGYAT